MLEKGPATAVKPLAMTSAPPAPVWSALKVEFGKPPSRVSSQEQFAGCCLTPASGWGRAETPANPTVETNKQFQAIDFLALPILHVDRCNWKDLNNTPSLCLLSLEATLRGRARTSSKPKPLPEIQERNWRIQETPGERSAQPNKSHILQQTI